MGEHVRRAMLVGRPEEAAVAVVDAHAHLGPWFNFRIPAPGVDGMLRTMDHCGIRVAWITADASIGPDVRLGNHLVAAAVAAHPERFRGYVTVNPHFPEEAADEVRRRYDAGWRLIKLHPGTHDHPADGPGYRRVWELADDHSLHVLSHSFPSMAALTALATTYRNATILAGHAASEPKRLPGYYEVCARCPNVYLDLCGSLLWRGLLEQIVAAVGAERVLYGSDIPFIDPRPQLGRVAFADLPDDALRLVLGGNALRIWERLAAAKGSPG